MNDAPLTNDPFAAPPSEPLAPGVLAPGMLAPSAPGTLSPAAPGVLAGAGYQGPMLTVSSGKKAGKLALWAIVLTGAYTAFAILSAAIAPQITEEMKDLYASLNNPGEPPVIGPAVVLTSLLSTPIALASMLLLASWMWRIRSIRTERGDVPGGIPAVEWWGWVVPLGSLVLPFLGMRKLTDKWVSMGIALGWWLPWVLALTLSSLSGFVPFGAMDLETGQYTKLEAFDVLTPIYVASGVLTVISWVFLVLTIRKTTAAVDANSAI